MANYFDQFDPAPPQPAAPVEVNPVDVGGGGGSGGNFFDQFDDKPPKLEPSTPAPPEDTILTDVQHVGEGLVTGLPNSLLALLAAQERGHNMGVGMPGADIVAGMFEPVVSGIKQQITGKTEAPIPTPRADAVDKGLRSVGMHPDQFFGVPQTARGRIARMAGEGAISILVPVGNKAKGLEKIFAIGKEMLTGGAGGAGAQLGMEYAPEHLKPAAALVGGLLGGGAGVAITEAPRAISNSVKRGMEYLSPLNQTADNLQRMAGTRLADELGDQRQPVLDALARREPTFSNSAETSAQATGNVKLGSMERALARSDDEFKGRLLDQRAAQAQAQLDALENVQASGSPSAVADFINARVRQLEDDADAIYAEARSSATKAADELGDMPAGEIGRTARSAVNERLASLNAENNALWKSIPKDTELVTPPIMRETARIYGTMSPEERLSLTPGEASIAGIIGSYGPTLTFDRFSALRSEISRAMRVAKNPLEPNNKAYARLSQLRGAVEDAVADSVAGKVAEDAAAVEAGKMNPEDAMAARFLEEAKKWYEQQGKTRPVALASDAVPPAAGSPTVPRNTGTTLETGRGPASPARDQGLPEDAGTRSYPVAPRDEWYGDANYETTGGRMTEMTPDEFLSRSRPLEIDDVARENIDDLKNHIQSGKTLDPLGLYKNGKEDGRHRAIAAKELGIKKVPVLDFRNEPDRYVGGLSIEQRMETQGRDYVPTDPDMAALEGRLSSAATKGAPKGAVASVKALSTEGRYGGIERAVDLEVNGTSYNPQPLWRQMLTEARDAAQDSVFLAREVPGNRLDPLKHRPAVELTFDTPVAREALDAELSKLAENGVEFLTVTVGGKPGVEGAMPAATGVRMIYMPEFERRYGFAETDLTGLDDAGLTAHMQSKADEMDDLIANVAAKVPGVRGRVAWYDTDVAFGSEYGERLGQTVGTEAPGQTAGGKAWRGQSVREGLAAADRHVQRTATPDGVRPDEPGTAGQAAEGSAAPVKPEPQITAAGEPVPTKKVLREQEAQELLALADKGDIDAILASPHLQDVTAQMKSIPETHKVEDFASDGWVLNRKYSTPEGQELKGAGPAIAHLLENARTLAATELGIPPYKVARQRKAVIVMGPPAAGKSTVANSMALELRAAIPDADEAKKIMPEYQGGIGANATHEESSLLAEAVLGELVQRGENLVIPKVGGKFASVEKTVKQLQAAGYTVDVALMDVPPVEAFRRMIGRYVRTGRLIPPNYFSEVAPAPAKVFDELKQKGSQDGFIRIKSERGSLPRVSEADARTLGLKVGDEIQFAKGDGAGAQLDRSGGNGGEDADALGSSGSKLITAEQADTLKRATAGTKAIKETYTGKGAQPVSGMLKRAGSTYPYDMPDATVGAALWRPGPAGATSIQRVLKAAGDAPKARNAIEAAAVQSLRRSAFKEGVLDPVKFEAWKAKHADALNEVPELAKRLSSVKRATDAMVEIGERRKAAMDKLQKSAIAKVMKVSSDADVTSTVASMLNGKNSVQAMREIAGAVRNDPEAMAGLRRAVIDHILTKQITSKGVLNAAQFMRWLGRNSPALSQVMSPEQMNSLRALAQELKRTTKDFRAPGGGSDTAENLAGQKRYGEERPSLLRKFLVDSGLFAGVSGALHIFNPGSPLLSAAVGAASALGSHAIQSAREAGLRRVNELVQEAILDPELMKALLAKAPNKANKGSHITLAERLGRIVGVAGVMSAGAD